MKFPRNGNIVIVDDVKDDAMPLIQILSKYNHPVIYLDGNVDRLPDVPLIGIRFLFLDLNLVGKGKSIVSDKNISSKTKIILDSIIDNKNGPIIVIFWTKSNDEVRKDVERYIKNKLKYVHTLTWNKEDYKLKSEYMINNIENEIHKKIEEIQSIELFIEWEDLIHRSTSEIVSEISRLYEFDENWSNNIFTIFYKLAESYKGKKVQESSKKIFKDSMFSLNSILSDHINKQLEADQMDLNGQYIRNENSESNCINSKINTKLLTFKRKEYFPGNIYTGLQIECPDICDILCNNKVLKEQNKEIKSIFLEITPMCDFVQEKMKKSRILPGFLYPYTFKIKKAEYIYKIDMIEWKDCIYSLVFDFRYFTSVKKESLDDSNIEFGLQSGQLADIQSKLASHIARIGTIGITKKSNKSCK